MVSAKEASSDNISERRPGINGEQEPHPDPHQMRGMHNHLYESLIDSDPGVQYVGEQIVYNPQRTVSCMGRIGPVNNSF